MRENYIEEIAEDLSAPLPLTKPKGWAASPSAPRWKHQKPGRSEECVRMRAKIIAKGIMEGKTTTQALIAAGYSPKTSERNVDQILNSPGIKKTIAEIFDRAGLSDEKIANQLRDLVHATKKTYFSQHGKVTDERSDSDYATRLAALGLTAKIKGIIVDKSLNLNVNAEISPIDLSKYMPEASNIDAEFEAAGHPPK